MVIQNQAFNFQENINKNSLGEWTNFLWKQDIKSSALGIIIHLKGDEISLDWGKKMQWRNMFSFKTILLEESSRWVIKENLPCSFCSCSTKEECEFNVKLVEQVLPYFTEEAVTADIPNHQLPVFSFTVFLTHPFHHPESVTTVNIVLHNSMKRRPVLFQKWRTSLQLTKSCFQTPFPTHTSSQIHY